MVGVCKIHVKKTIAFLCTSNEQLECENGQLEFEDKDTIPFTLALNV